MGSSAHLTWYNMHGLGGARAVLPQQQQVNNRVPLSKSDGTWDMKSGGGACGVRRPSTKVPLWLRTEGAFSCGEGGKGCQPGR